MNDNVIDIEGTRIRLSKHNENSYIGIETNSNKLFLRADGARFRSYSLDCSKYLIHHFEQRYNIYPKIVTAVAINGCK